MTLKKSILLAMEILPIYYLGYYGRQGVDFVLYQLGVATSPLIRYMIYLALVAVLVTTVLKVNSYIEKRYFRKD